MTPDAGLRRRSAVGAANAARALPQPAFISMLPDARIATHEAEAPRGPLHGLTFAVKDNIDLLGLPTTAADPRNTKPSGRSASSVQRLVDAGAVPIGKTNLDQYATGLVGTRTPFGACHSVFSSMHVSGGSSSGSAVAVAAGVVDFALGTDTAGSGRVPAAFNGIVGIKPSRGLVPTDGVVPACRSLDCVSLFARSVSLAREVFSVWAPTAGPSLEHTPVIGVPNLDLDLDPEHEKAWQSALEQARAVGVVVEVDVRPFLDAAALLYSGPWLAERWIAFGARLDDDPMVDPTVREIVGQARGLSAEAVFEGMYRLTDLAENTRATWQKIDVLLLPVTATHPTFADVVADPVGVNNRLGRFTNMTNLLDLCAVAVPGPAREDGLPFGVQFLAPSGFDGVALDVAALWTGESEGIAEPATDTVLLAVAGAHLTDEPLNPDLVRRGGKLERPARMAADYRMFTVDGPVPRPGVTRVAGPSEAAAEHGLEVELWRLPVDELAGFMATIAPPLGIGPVDLDDGSRVLGFICTADGVNPERDITRFGGWRAYVASAVR